MMAAVTREMKAAGENALAEFDLEWDDRGDCVSKVFLAMTAASSRGGPLPVQIEKPIDELAHERASSHAQRPTYDPMHAGGAGLVFCAVALLTFHMLAGVPVDTHGVAILVTLALGFALPFAFYKLRERTYDRAWAKEYKGLRDAQARKAPSSADGR